MAEAVKGSDDDSRVVVFQGRAYHGIREIGVVESGAFVLSFHTTPAPMPRGGFWTAIPISPASYRAWHPTMCGFADEGRQIVVWDDWDNMYRIAASREVLDQLIANMREHNLPERDDGAMSSATEEQS